MPSYKKYSYYKDEDIHAYVEDIDDQIFLHVDFLRVNKNAIRKTRQKWGEVILKLYEEGYEEAYTYTQDVRFVNLIGGAKKIGQHENYGVYVWELGQ